MALQYGVLMGGQANSSFLVQIDLGSNKIVRKSSCPEKLTSIVLSCEESIMIGAGMSGTIYVWSCVQGLLLGQFKAHSKGVNKMKVLSGGSAVISCSDDGLLQMIHLGDIIQ